MQFVVAQPAQERAHDFFVKMLFQFRVPRGRRAEGSHAARIRPLVSIFQPLVIAGGSEHLIVVASDQDVQGTLPTFEEFFDQDLRSALPNRCRSIMSAIACIALAASGTISTPLPAASPSALITTG